MFKKTCVQRVSAIITAVGMVMALTSASYNRAMASELEIVKDDALLDFETNANNLVDDYDEDSELCQKLELDYENSTTDLSEEREKELNSIGVFDSDIEALDDDMLEKLDNAYAYSMSVMYYGENAEDGTLEELSPAETDEVIKDVYGEELEEAAQDKDVLEQALENTIFGAVKASAHSDNDKKRQNVDSGIVKQMLACIQKTKGGRINVIYTISWLERPSHIKTDVAGVSLKNASPIRDTFKAYYKCDWKTAFDSEYKSSKDEIDKIESSGYGMAASFSFYDGSLVLMQYKNDVFIMSFDCTVDNKKNINGMSATGKYYHCKAKKTISPGISIGPDGVSISVSGSSSDVYSTVRPNTYVQFFPK